MTEYIFKGKKYQEPDYEEQMALHAANIHVFHVFLKEKLFMASDVMVECFGLKKFVELNQDKFEEQLTYKEDVEKVKRMYSRLLAGEKVLTERFTTENGKKVYQVTMTVGERDASQKPISIIGVMEDYDERMKQAEMIQLLSVDYDSIFCVDFETDLLTVQRTQGDQKTRYEEYLKTHPNYSTAISKYIEKEVIEEEKNQMRVITSHAFLERQLANARVFMHDFRVICDGAPVYYRLKVVNNSEGEKLSKVVIGLANIDKEMQAQWENIAFYDQITLGRNYSYYTEKLKKETRPGFIVSMDIRSFKVVNDVCGIAKGDFVLQKASYFVEKAVSKKGYYGHVNADHFVFYLAVKTEEEVVKILDRISKDIDKLVRKEDMPKIGAYYGVTRWEPGDRIQVIFSEANQAKHRIKNLHHINYGFYRDEDNAIAIEEKKIEDAFETAMAAGEFEVWYQPKYSPIERELTGAEALVRWRKSDGNLISPAKFIPVFERNGMIRQLDEYVFTTVCRQQKKWIETIGRTVPISINLSRASLYYANIVEAYKKIANDEGVLPELLPIEITESAAVNNADIKELANRFFRAGFPLHIDDFGTGYSSLSTLNLMKFDTLKLDKTLIDFIGEFGGDRLIKHTVALAKDLGLHVTAEGVEKEEQIEFLNKVECDNIQGFIYSRPLPAEFFSDKLMKEKMSDKYMYRKGQIYTYPVIVEDCKRACSSAAAEEIQGNAAVQVNIRGDGEGAFYIELRNGKVDVQPYEYYDRNALIIADAETFLDIVKGKNTLENAYAEGKIEVEGDWGAALLVQQMLHKDQHGDTK